MGNDDLITDDFVAGLLVKEANDCSLKYSTHGLEAYQRSKLALPSFDIYPSVVMTRLTCPLRPANKAKPNTNFLRHIIKETKSHNEALLAKEAAESQARLNDLTGADEKRRKRMRPDAGDMRRRQLGDISAILQGGKRKREREEDSERPRRSASRERYRGEDTERRSKSRREKSSTTKDGSKTEKERDRHHRHSRREETSDDERRRRRRRSRDRERSRSPGHRERKHRHRSPVGDEDDSRRRPGTSRRRDQPTSSSNRKQSPSRRKRSGAIEEEEDSDPLDDFIGPQPSSEPTVRPRGRGAARGASGMDGRFSENYDPKSDVQPDADEEDDDWEEALEAMRDRQKWKQQGAERLRAAGFTDDQVKKWENGDHKDVQDVRWSKAGESREWDRGKSNMAFVGRNS